MTALNIDGPHSPDYTREVAATMAECVRVLNHATQKDGLRDPADAYELLSYLKGAVGSLPQLLQQTHEFLDRSAEAGKVYDTHGRRPAEVVADAHNPLASARMELDDLYRSLDRAQQAIANLAARQE